MKPVFIFTVTDPNNNKTWTGELGTLYSRLFHDEPCPVSKEDLKSWLLDGTTSVKGYIVSVAVNYVVIEPDGCRIYSVVKDELGTLSLNEKYRHSPWRGVE